MMTLFILNSLNFTKTQKSRYLENKTFSLRPKNRFVVKVTFKILKAWKYSILDCSLPGK